MLLTTLALTLLAQQPGAASAWAESEPVVAGAVPVEGTLELTRGEAEAAALSAAREFHRGRLLSIGQELAERQAPFWLPSFAVTGEVEAWARELERRVPLRVLQRDTRVHNYSYGEAYQTTVHVAAGAAIADSQAEHRLERGLQRLGRLLLAKLGGIAVFWGLLAFGCSWFDRLTRGYMPWRLRFIALAMGLVVPAAVLLV